MFMRLRKYHLVLKSYPNIEKAAFGVGEFLVIDLSVVDRYWVYFLGRFRCEETN